MNFSGTQWDGLAELYLQANSGSFLPGIVHNLNNFSHVMDLQLELLQTKIPQIQSGSFGNLETRFQRIASASKDLLIVLENIGNRFFFTQKENTQINIEQYFDWLLLFWKHNLSFKHKIDLKYHLHPDCPNLDVPPFLLTLCIEEGLKNGIEACQVERPDACAPMAIAVGPDNTSIRIAITTPGTLKLESDPFAWGTTSKPGHLGMGLSLVSHFAEKSGWKVSLESQGTETVYTLLVPGGKTVVSP